MIGHTKNDKTYLICHSLSHMLSQMADTSRLYNSSGVPDLSSMPDKAEDLVIIRDAINWKQNTSIM